jgi:hypothetical protein
MIYKTLCIVLIIAAANLSATSPKYTREDTVSPDVLESITGMRGALRASFQYKEPGLIASIYSLGTRRQPREILLLWHQIGDKFQLTNVQKSFVGETFEKPVWFTIQDFQFVNIATEPVGSGGFVNDTILWLAPDGTLHEVEFQQASEAYEAVMEPDQMVLTGGEKEFFVEDGAMKFEFSVASQGDPHCCPSGGIVAGNYKLSGQPKFDAFARKYSANFRISVDNLQYSASTALSSQRP